MGATGTPNGYDWCELCTNLYNVARDLINNRNIKSLTTITTGFLCSAAEMSIGGLTGGWLGVACTEVARRIINYVRQNGFSDPAEEVCESLNLCPPDLNQDTDEQSG